MNTPVSNFNQFNYSFQIEALNGNEHHGEEEEEQVCVVCREIPCDWIWYGKELTDHVKNTATLQEKDIQMKDKWKILYRLFTYAKYGHLGRGHRIPIPNM